MKLPKLTPALDFTFVEIKLKRSFLFIFFRPNESCVLQLKIIVNMEKININLMVL